MKENNVLAAILTVAFYTGRGGAIGLPQIVSTYEEMKALLGKKKPKKASTKK